MIREHEGLLAAMLEQLERMICELNDISGNEAAYYQSIQKMIAFKLQEYHTLKQLNEFNSIISAMTRLDFSAKLDIRSVNSSWAYIGAGLNILSEELAERVISKEIVQLALNDIADAHPDWVLITTKEGIIQFSSRRSGSALRFEDKKLIKKRVQNFFTSHISFTATLNTNDANTMAYFINDDSTKVPIVLHTKELRSRYQDIVYYLYFLKEM